jgi:hypothetical protein
MKRIFVPTRSYEDWRLLLAQPDLHWKVGYSAMTLARAWEDAADGGFPPEVRSALSTAPSLGELRPLLVMPEYQVPLPGGERASQTDVLVIARSDAGLAVVAVEGKVDETFGPTLAEQSKDASTGANERIRFVWGCLGLTGVMPPGIRYQLIHRSASAVLTAREFFAQTAVVLVHSFSEIDRRWSDFQAFAKLFGKAPAIGQVVHAGRCGEVDLFIGWCKGEQRFRQA